MRININTNNLIEAVTIGSQMAGNSIVVSCMDLIFENLFFPKKRENTLF